MVDPLSSNQAHTPRRVLGTLSAVNMPAGEGRQEHHDMLARMSGQEMGAASKETGPFSSSMMIGMEQVRYQMGTADESRNASANREHVITDASILSGTGNNVSNGRKRPGAMVEQYTELEPNALAGTGLSPWAYNGFNGFNGDMDFSIGAEPYDWPEFSADVGWIADPSLSRMI